MNKFFALPAAAALSLAMIAAVPQQAQAAGCIKGALVGGAAGYAAGHTFLGAAAGCLTGRALAKRQAAERARQQQEGARPLPPPNPQGRSTGSQPWRPSPQGQNVGYQPYGHAQPGGGTVYRSPVWGQPATR